MLEGQWGLTPLRDQQIGGLIMWVPMCLAYAGAIFGQIARWYTAPAALNHT
jgi:putative membrane protein